MFWVYVKHPMLDHYQVVIHREYSSYVILIRHIDVSLRVEQKSTTLNDLFRFQQSTSVVFRWPMPTLQKGDGGLKAAEKFTT